MGTKPASDWLLVVEDNIDVWLVLRALLPRALPEAGIVHAAAPSAALVYLQECLRVEHDLPQLILQDWYMPERTDGMALLTQLKHRDSAYRHIPVVVMSSSIHLEDVTDAYFLGASTFLSKPISIDEWTKQLYGLRQYWPEADDSTMLTDE